MNWKHDDLLEDLAGHLRAPDRMVWTDMQLGPSGSPRPDVFTIQKSYSKPRPSAYEIKVSRSDLRSDTTSGKWQSYLKYAGSVVFAVPDGLCTVADIPDGCGLMVRKAAVWRYVRKPTLQTCELPRDAWMKLLIDGVERVSRAREAHPRRVDTWRPNEKVLKKFGEAVAFAARDLVAAQERIARAKSVADYEHERMTKEVESRKQYLLEQAKKQLAEFEAAKLTICEWLGIEPECSVFEVRRKIGDLKASCSADARVRLAEQRLSNAQRCVEQALQSFSQNAPGWAA